MTREYSETLILKLEEERVRLYQRTLELEAAIAELRQEIEARQWTEEQLSAVLQEKEVLLKEIHHRVKNNLQVISSLLRLQAASIDDARVRELFADSQRRIRAMALIHEQLYQSTNLANINLRDYIADLVDYLRHSQFQTDSKIQVRVNVESMIVELDQAMPLGLLINELVSNCLKHAFPSLAGEQVGQVWINAWHEAAGLTLIVGDNGIGLPDNLDLEHSSSMGMQIIRTLVAQLQGQFTVQRKPGAVFTVTIPERKI